MPKPDGKYIWTATVGEKGQIVIPKQARTLFDIKPGDVLMLFGDMEKGIVIPQKDMLQKIMGSAFDIKEEEK